MTPGATAEADVVTDRGLFVYGVVDADRELPDGLTGVDGTPVRAVTRGPVAAVVGEIDLERTSGRRADLVAYSDVLNALAEAGPVAPVQFGSVLLEERDVEDDLLAPNEEEFAELLASLRGRVQLNLRAAFREQVVLAEILTEDPEIRRLNELTRGRSEDQAYAERVRLGELVSQAMEDKREAEAEALLDSILPLTASYSLRVAGPPEQVLDVALLVDDDRREELEDHLEALAEAVHERIELSLVGPVAPFDFVGGEAWG